MGYQSTTRPVWCRSRHADRFLERRRRFLERRFLVLERRLLRSVQCIETSLVRPVSLGRNSQETLKRLFFRLFFIRLLPQLLPRWNS